MATFPASRTARALFAAALAAALLLTPAASAMSPGNLFPTLTYPEADSPTVSTKNATCGLFGCRSDG